MHNPAKRKLLYLGNVLSGHGLTPTTIETLSERLSADIDIILASSRQNKILRLLDMWWHIWRFRNHVDLVMIDTYSSSAFIFAWTSATICRVLKMPYIAFLHGGDLPTRFKNSPGISKKYILGAAEVVSPSGYLQEKVKQNFQRKSLVIPNYLDLQNYTFKQRAQIPSLNILWVRSFHATYQPDLALQATALLQKQGITVKLAMVGPNKDGSLEKCQNLAKELGIEDIVEFTGRLSKEEWIKKSGSFDVFINTTSVDNTPVSVMEAMALGMPVISTKVGGIPFLFQDGTEGIMVNEQTPEAFVEAMLTILNEPDKTKAISVAARKKAEEWDWQIVRLKWLQLLNSI